MVVYVRRDEIERETFVRFSNIVTDIIIVPSHTALPLNAYIIDINKLTFACGIIGDFIDMTMTMTTNNIFWFSISQLLLQAFTPPGVGR